MGWGGTPDTGSTFKAMERIPPFRSRVNAVHRLLARQAISRSWASSRLRAAHLPYVCHGLVVRAQIRGRGVTLYHVYHAIAILAVTGPLVVSGSEGVNDV